MTSRIAPLRGSRLTRSLLAAMSLSLVASVTMAPGPATDEFEGALRIAASYHRELSGLPARYIDQPETATDEFERLTAAATEAQYEVAIEPCFARWWAYEYMGLELAALSLELRRTHEGYAETADTLERLGARMWSDAMSLLPDAASACGLEQRPSLRLSLP